MSDSVFHAWDRMRVPSGLRVVAENEKPLEIRPARLRAGPDIEPREWLYGTLLISRYISVLVSPGGVGKTAWSLAVGCSVACGKGLVGDYVHRQENVLFCFLEDPEDEFDRRIAACMIRHRLDEEDLAGRVFHLNGRDRRIVVAALDGDGMTVCYPDKPALINAIRARKIGLVVVDPFVNSHELDENSNPHINAAARAWAEIANETGCAVLLVHHTRKGAVAGDADSGRGAIALVNAARSAFTLTAMSEDEAKELGVSDDVRRLHIRLDDAKANLAPPSAKARWYRLASIALGNARPDYPNGDNVQAIEKWEPPDIWRDLSVADCNAALDAIAEGPGGGRRYTASRAGQGGGARWAGRVLTRMFCLNDEQAARIIKTWVRNGVLEEGTYTDPDTRKSVSCVLVNNSRRPG